MLQLNPYIWVTTPLGDGQAVALIDYGLDHNTCWVVGLEKDGQVKHFDSNDIRLCTNYTYGINVPDKKNNAWPSLAYAPKEIKTHD